MVGAIRVARTAAEALALLLGTESRPAAWTPRLILLDLRLPQGVGLEVLRRLRSERRTQAYK